MKRPKEKKKRGITSHPSETILRGQPRNLIAAKIMRERKCSRATSRRILARRQARKQSHRERLVKSTGQFSPLIKPSDNWNFSNIVYERSPQNGHGYIPGEVYANCLWYWTKAGDIVAAPMAGCGQIERVYSDRALWMRPQMWDLNLRMFDLTPQLPQIQANDLTKGLPLKRAHYIVLDVPYLHIVGQQYSDKPNDLANMDEIEWSKAMKRIAKVCRSVQKRGDYCTVIATNYRKQGHVTLATTMVRAAFTLAEYQLADLAYASRRIQQKQTFQMAKANNNAKRDRLMLSDIAEVMTFKL